MFRVFLCLEAQRKGMVIKMEIHGTTTWGKGDFRCPVTFCDGKLTFHARWDDYVLPSDGIQNLIIEDYDGQKYLFHLACLLKDTGSVMIEGDGAKSTIWGNYTVDVDFIVKNFNPINQYKKCIVEFAELDSFIPSCCAIKYDGTIFSCTETKVTHYEEQFEFQGISFVLSLQSNASVISGEKIQMFTSSQIIVKGEDCLAVDEIVSILNKIKILFAFLCNRQNVALKGATLKWEKTFPEHFNSKGEIVPAKQIPENAQLIVFDKFAEGFENENVIKKTIKFKYIEPGFTQLFKFVLDDHISYNNIHSSYARRNLFDLEQSIGVTASFERYVRDWLPDMISDATKADYKEAQEVLTKYITTEGLTGKRKDHFKAICKSVGHPPLPLEQKIIKAYKGYEKWESLCSCFEEDYSGKIIVWAKEANDWRNELAHDKASYTPSLDTILAIRFIEKLNYCILLRETGFSNERIKSIIPEIFQ